MCAINARVLLAGAKPRRTINAIPGAAVCELHLGEHVEGGGLAIRACRRSGNDRVVKHYRWRRWRTEGELIIGLSDQCERNYPLDRSGSGAYLQHGKQQHDIERRTAMNLQMGDAAPHVEPEATEVMLGTRKHNGGALTDLFQAIARSTACSSRVFYGLLAWANLNAQMADASSL